ncbi:MAG: AmmeMemoRadiSam system radical SAM enzyme [Spirochaetales bacterium]|nr:AmmeMemoRadiSam system radical SAM enzyme [Spirochaetales bacterium]
MTAETSSAGTTGKIHCEFCFHRCRLGEGKIGICGVRKNLNGKMITTVYGQVVSAGVDPIEKKPFYHVRPGTSTLSAALPGCNFQCLFCQNHAISQYNESQYALSGSNTPLTSPQKLMELMLGHNLEIMTYTYSDPVVWQDYMLDTAKLVKEKENGLNCMITNGSMTHQSLIGMLDYIDAFNIDVKGNEEFYRKFCKGSFIPVLNNLERISADGRAVVEVTTLVLEGEHTLDEIYWLGSRLRGAGVKVWHLSRFFPAYKMRERQATSETFLNAMLQTASESGIPFIYSGNSQEQLFTATVCPGCGTALIPTHSYGGEAGISVNKYIRDGKCLQCGEHIYGLF